MSSAVFANRAERLIAAASAFLLVPDLSEPERDAVYNARAAVRRGLNMRESIAAGRTPADQTEAAQEALL